MRVERVGPDEWELFRGIRLRSLADAPDAFGSTLEREEGFDEADWRRRLTGPVYAVLDPEPVAVGGLFAGHGVPQVWGMWTDPDHRHRGHARRVLDALLPPGSSAQLDVNVANDCARATYLRYGFVSTGRIQPLRPGSAERTEHMVLSGQSPRTPAAPSASA